jgi:hypothetical protein
MDNNVIRGRPSLGEHEQETVECLGSTMSEMPVEVFVIYDACRETASVVFDWGGPAAEVGVVARTQNGVHVEFSSSPPARLLALTVARPFFGRDTTFVRHLYELLGNSVLSKLLMADTVGSTSATTVPMPPTEVEDLLACWERFAPPRLDPSAEERTADAEQSPGAERTAGERAVGVIDLAKQRLQEWFIPLLLHPVVARQVVPSALAEEGAGACLRGPVIFHGRVTLREDLARIGGIHPVARADVLDGRLLLRAQATGATPSGKLVISCLGSQSAELTVTPDGSEFRAELVLPIPPSSVSLADDYACVLSFGLSEEPQKRTDTI